MHLNKSYGKLNEEGVLEYAPKSINGKLHPTADDYALFGYLPIVDIFPSEPAPIGHHYEPQGWKIDDTVPPAGIISRVYVIVENPPPPPKVYQTADVIEALMNHNVWNQCREWIEEQGLLDLVFTTKEFADNWPNFIAARQGLQQLLGWTDAQVEELLTEALGVEAG